MFLRSIGPVRRSNAVVFNMGAEYEQSSDEMEKQLNVGRIKMLLLLLIKID